MQNINKKIWVISADMGYGHQRTTYPLNYLANEQKIINANSYDDIPRKDKNFWKNTRFIYEFISRFKKIPLLGDFVFSFLDKFQKIMHYYPKRDLSKPNTGVKSNYYFIKRGWGKHLIEKLKANPLPIITSFFTPAFMAEKNNYPNDIYCIICDADINRAWAPLNPKNSKIKYFAPCTWVRERLHLYGVNPKNIFLTGYPLPKENLGSENLEIAKEDLKNRLANLDPLHRYRKMYKPLIESYLGEIPEKSNHPLTIMFSIGGAGAQKEIGLYILNSLKEKINSKLIRVIISVGTKEHLKNYYQKYLDGLNLDGWAHILSGKTTFEYFKEFNKYLRQTDILWTKPSELSFYSGLGIPIIIAPTIGSQEDFNKRWLLHIGSAVNQEDPKHTDQWLFDMIYSGNFAEMAMQGFVEIEKKGIFNIEKIVFNK